MTLTPHSCASGGVEILCVCTTGRDHGEDEMDLPGGELDKHRAASAVLGGFPPEWKSGEPALAEGPDAEPDAPFRVRVFVRPDVGGGWALLVEGDGEASCGIHSLVRLGPSESPPSIEDIAPAVESVAPWLKEAGFVVTDVQYADADPPGPKVQLIAWTHFDGASMGGEVGWETDMDGGQALAEFAGRACYQSWAKPNPATATNAGYIRHILDVGHLSVLEHGSVSFYLTGISRSLTHELVRHRHFSYSQLSQRYVAEDDTEFVVPPAIAAIWSEPPADPNLATRYASVGDMFTDGVEHARIAYKELSREVAARLLFKDGDGGMTKTELRKHARQAARAVLPNATETRIVVTGNYRAWRHFIAMRATKHADVEIRAVAVMILRELQRAAPNVFADFKISALPDGTEVAESVLAAAE